MKKRSEREKTDETTKGCSVPPEGLKQNRETEGLCFLFLNGEERSGR